MNDNANEPAYPTFDRFMVAMSGGLSKREAFAMAAMQGICGDWADHPMSVKDLADLALQVADELLAKLAKPREPK